MTTSVFFRLKNNLDSVVTQPWFYWLVVSLVFTLAFFLRFYGWQNYPFGFDQVQILENAEKIKQGDITLIGPRTGPAPMFTGPLIYYVTAALLFVIPSPYTMVAVALLMSVVTGIVLFWLVNRFQTREYSLILLTLWALAPIIVTLDRIPWNPNFTIMAAALCVIPLLEVAQTKKVSRVNVLSLAAGTFLGYQAHFSGLLLPGLVIASLLLLKPFRWQLAVAALAGLGLSLIPTVLFDLRNNWLNFNGFLSVISGKTEGPSRLDSLIVSTVTVLSNWGRLLLAEFSPILAVLIGVVLLGSLVYVVLVKERKVVVSVAALPLLWIVVTTLSLSFYRGNKPEYYFLLLVPVYLWWTSLVMMMILKKASVRGLVLSILLIYSLVTVIRNNRESKGMNLGNQVAVRATMAEDLNLKKVQTVTYDMEAVHSLGLRYLLRDADLQPAGKIIHLQYPYQQGTLNSTHFSDVGLWVDPRTDINRTYVTQPSYLVSVPNRMQLLQDLPRAQRHQGHDTYVVFNQSQVVGELVIFQREPNTDAFDQLVDPFEQTYRQDEWAAYQYQGQAAYAYWSSHYFLVFKPEVSSSLDLVQLVNEIKLIY